MKRTAFVVCTLLVSCCALAQSSALDSLKSSLNSTTISDSNKVNVCMQLSNAWLKTNSDSALHYANRSYQLASFLKNQRQQADARCLQAKTYKALGKYDKAFEYYLEALRRYTMQHNASGIGLVNLQLGETFEMQEDYVKALAYYQDALAIYTKGGLKSGIATTSFQIGKVHSRLKQHAEAITYFQKAANFSVGLADRHISIACYNNLCFEYNKTGAHIQALQAAFRARNLALIAGIIPGVGEAYLNLGDTYNSLSKSDSAQSAYITALSYFQQLRNREKIAKTYVGIAKLYFLKQDYVKSTQYIKLSNQYANDMEAKGLLMSNYQMLVEIAKAGGEYKNATMYFEELLTLKDSLSNSDKNNSIGKVRSAYELEKRQAKIAELEEDNQYKTRQRNLFLTGFAIVAICLVALGYSITQVKKKTAILEKQKKELEELNLVKDKFFSIIGHDLRSPMANILGLLQLLTEDTSMTREEMRLMFEKLRFSTGSALETMDNILAWGMNQIKEGGTDTREVDVQEITQRVCRFLQQTADNKSVQIINHVNEPVKIFADKNHVEFILRNLVSNALKFSHQNGVIELWASSAVGKKNIHIRDTGTGMSPEIKHKLFDDNKKGSVKGTAGETGTGLGLFLSKQFINKNNGSLSVRSEQGKGSVFTVTLPQAY